MLTIYNATKNNENIVQNAKVGIGFNDEISKNAQLEIRSHDKGLLIPRMATVERDGITTPDNSLLIFNTDTSCFNFYKIDKWKSICGDLGTSEINISDCSSVGFVGNYTAGTFLNNGNFFQITVNVLEPGDYKILVDSKIETGVFFEKTGFFPKAGVYTIQIPGVGTPTKVGNISFDVKINDEITNCKPVLKIEAATASFNSIVFTDADVLYRGQPSIGKKINITVNVVNPGIFNFYTENVNGLTYSASNVNLNTAGVKTVSLYANGNPPTLTGDFQYLINGNGNEDTNSVYATVKVEESNATITSVDCTNSKAYGTYLAKQPLGISNYVSLNVNVGAVGNYSVTISSTTDPEFSFSTTGTFTKTGLNVIKIPGSGTPKVGGAKSFEVKINGKVECILNFSVTSLAINSIILNGAYKTIYGLNSANFGTSGISKANYNAPYLPWTISDYDLKLKINQGKCQVIIIGYDTGTTNYGDKMVNVLAEFIERKGGFVFFQGPENQQNFIKKLIDRLYGSNVVFANRDYKNIDGFVYNAKYNADTTNNPYLNGPFGDIRGKYIRAEGYWSGITPESTPPQLKSLITFSNEGGDARNTLLYGKGLLIGSDNVQFDQLGHNYGASLPYMKVPDPGAATYGKNYWDGANIIKGDLDNHANVTNYLLLGNALDYISKYIDENYNATYKIP